MTLPTVLTPLAVAAAGWAAFAGDWRTGLVPALVGAAAIAAAYARWRRRGRPWHDWGVILLHLPAIGAGVWIAVGGLVLGIEREHAARLAVEVGPGIALLGLGTAAISYHGRHHPEET